MNAQTEPLQRPARGSLDVFSVILVLWRHWKWIAAFTIVTSVAGVAYSLLATPVYYSEATASPREPDDGRSATANLIAQLGSVGGLVAARLGASGTNLERVDIILRGNELAESVIRKHELLPVLFPQEWDARARAWKGGASKAPSLRLGAKKLREQWLVVNVNSKKGLFSLGIQANDSVLAKNVVEYYLEALADRVREDVMRNTDVDREYLETQLATVSDPVLRERIMGLIAAQIEKSMLVRSQVFDVIEKPLVPIERKSPKRKRIVILSFFFGLLGSSSAIFFSGAVSRFWKELRARARASE